MYPVTTYMHLLCNKRELQSLPSEPMASPAIAAAKAVMASIDLSGYDPVQSRLMDEQCILVDENDNAVGAMDKKTCQPFYALMNLRSSLHQAI